MGNNTGTAYNPNDPLQAGFLAAIAAGETGNSPNAATLGTGGVNLASIISAGNVDQYGFPQWSGTGNSHAAGTYQFQPATWDSIASQYGLNFSNAGDQAEGAWYDAEQVYAAKTGGASLETALQTGNYSSVQSALSSEWTSVTGNASNPQGLAATLGSYISKGTAIVTGQTNANNTSSATQTGTATSSGQSANGTAVPAASSGGISGFVNGIWNGITGTFTQTALIILGGIVILVALWMLLSNQGVVPSPAEAAKGALAL